MQIRPARVFNALHGQMGEDGNIQGLLNLLNIPYTHSGVMASAIAMDKPMTKKVLAKSGIHFAEDITLTIHPDNRITTETSGAIVIKPRNTGSSFGVSIVHEGGEMPRADHWPQGTKLIAERFIPGRELTVSVLHGEPLTVTEISQDNAFYDYEAKYAAGGSQHQLPADIDSTTFATAMAWAALAHKELECRGVSRSDFRFDDDTGALVMLEINTQPGMTSTSLVPEQAQFKGISMTELMTSLLEAAQCD
jgi:D-alanine-D-alanine ligase